MENTIMRLTRFTDYSLRALVYLGQNTGKRVTITEISEVYGISKNHLMKVVSNLTRMGVVAAQRGPGGGIRLNHPSEDIGLAGIISNTEKHLREPIVADLSCEYRSDTESRLQDCLQQAIEAYLEALDQFTLADILEPGSSVPELLKLNENTV